MLLLQQLRGTQVYQLHLARRWLPGMQCSSRHTQWNAKDKQETQLRRYSVVMGLTNQKVHCDRWTGSESQKRGKSNRSDLSYLKDPKLNKGLAFTHIERDDLGISGLLPPAFRNPAQQVRAVMENIRRYKDDLTRYLFMRDLQDHNEKLFYRVLDEHTEELLPLVYTPVVGQACREYSTIFSKPRGLFISLEDAGSIYNILGNWPEDNVKVDPSWDISFTINVLVNAEIPPAIVVTDGERILGLGDLGCNGMGIPVGKMALFTALAGIQPSTLMPVLIDVGTNNDMLLSDPVYIGLRHKRVTGEKYDKLIEEFMQAVVKRYGRSCLIQFEDFGNQNAFRLLEKYKDQYCTFNDDIQGTASVTVAGLLASLKITGTKVSEHTFLFYGAGEAALGIAELLVMEMEEEGLSKKEAADRIWLVDSKGLVVKGRPGGVLNGDKPRYAKNHEYLLDLEDMMRDIKPTVLIGASAQPAVFTEKVLRMMASTCERPIIFALSNPTDKAECTAEQAYTYTDGKCVFASGSPFPPFTFNGQTFHPGQGNNAYIFPGVAFALIACSATTVSERTFLVAARALSELVSKDHIDQGRVYPPLEDIRSVSLVIATKVAHFLFEEGHASYFPKPPDMEAYLKSQMYSYEYEYGNKRKD